MRSSAACFLLRPYAGVAAGSTFDSRNPFPTRRSARTSPDQCFWLFAVMLPILACSTPQGHLYQLTSADRRDEHLVEGRTRGHPRVLPAVRRRQLLDPHRVRRVEHAVEIVPGGQLRDLE